MSKAVEGLRREMNEREQRRGPYQGADQTAIRMLNEKLILNYIRLEGPLSRVEIADRLGLSRATVSSIINTLIGKELVEEGDRFHVTLNPKGGKRATAVGFKADAGYIIGIDIGRRHLTIVLRNLEVKRPDNTRQWSESDRFDTGPGAEVCLSIVAEKLENLLKTHDVTWDQVVGIGIGIPGTLDRDLRKLTDPPLMPKWCGIDIPMTLRRLLKLKGQTKIPIYLDNDANMGALGESRYGAGRDSMNMIYIKIGAGIGAGLILNGRLYRGERGTAGEFGHIIIDKSGPKCERCQNHGCLEVLASVPAIMRKVGHANDDIDIEQVVEFAKNGDVACSTAIEDAARHTGVALANLIDLLCPEEIILDELSGGIVEAAGELFLTPLRKQADKCTLQAAKGTSIDRGELGNEAIALGAAAMIIDAAFMPDGAVPNVRASRIG